MTELEWLTSVDPQRLLSWATGLWPENAGDPRLAAMHRAKGARTLRLYACALWDSIRQTAFMHAERVNAMRLFDTADNAVSVAEMYADGQANQKSLGAVREQTAGLAAIHWMNAANKTCWQDGSLDDGLIPIFWMFSRDRMGVWAELLRDIVGNPFAPVPPPYEVIPSRWHNREYVLRKPWLTPTVSSIAHAAYHEKDWLALPVLADALEEAGCDVPELLAHLRGPGPHVRGCWAVDLVLGKS